MGSKVRTAVLLILPLLAHALRTASSGDGLSPPMNEDGGDVPFGRPLRAQFLLADGFTNFNHGSFGSVPRIVIEQQRAFTEQMEARPDVWFREAYFPLIDEARRMLAEYVNAPVDDLVMVENASGGVNSVLRSIDFSGGGIILYFSEAYNMVKFTAKWVAATNPGVVALEVPLGDAFPDGGDASILEPLRAALASNIGKVRLVIFSHITSVPGVILPVKEMMAACRDPSLYGTGVAPLVLVDGAHALGQIPIDIKDLDPDFYVANAHKWLYSPKGSAFLYVRKSVQEGLSPEPPVISSSGKRDFVGRFEYTGSRDYTAFAAVPAAFRFRASLGDAKINEYITALARWAGVMLAERWGTRVIGPPHMQGFMFNVELPTNSSSDAVEMQARLARDYDVCALSLQLGGLQGVVYTRLSAQVYLERADFEELAVLVPKILREIQAEK